ncbi:zinc ribbon domain-containing protein [Virgibacillus doumboii]|uniref:zinc ribbon domain-containing protein n=1 Tax=Virgibacillus doumboii TaxID=2697503 RepID=UPI003CCE50D1
MVKVKPHYTSQNCSGCRNQVKKSLSIRTHICTDCEPYLTVIIMRRLTSKKLD